jgi:TolB-like protein/Flp pilus assembly protein TadD
MGEDEVGTRTRFSAHLNELIKPAIENRQGRIVKTLGDGLLVEFPSVVDSVQCAAEIQKGIAERNAGEPDDRRIDFRIGINLGDVIIEGDDIHGDGINVAARLESVAQPGTVVVSGTVHEQVKGKVEFGFVDLGPQDVKNIKEPVRAYRISIGNEIREGGASASDGLIRRLPSIAVLPFANMSGDPEQEYFADGIAEDLITALSRFQWFFVIARNSSFSYKGQSPDIRQVARDLGVQYVLEGSVRRSGERVRVTGQLIEAESGTHVWAERYDGDLQDIFALQDEITESIAAAVAPQFISAEARRVERNKPESFDAWDCAIRGNWHLWHLSKQHLLEAARLFRSAIKMDSKSSLAHSGLGAAMSMLMINGWVEDVKEAGVEALQSAQRAIEADRHDAWAHAVFGFVSTLLRRNEDALRAGHRALELNPSLAFAEGVLSVTYGHIGDSENAIKHHDRATRLSPKDQSAAWWNLGQVWAAFTAADYSTSLDWVRKITEAMPGFPAGWRLTATNCAHLGQIDEARNAIDRLLGLLPNDCISFIRAHVPADNPEVFERYIGGLRKAGLPE